MNNKNTMRGMHHNHKEMEGQNLSEMSHQNHQEREGYNKHAGHSTEMFKKRFYISLVLTVPIIILSPFFQQFFRFSLSFAGDGFAVFLISSFIFFFGGWPFLIGAFNEIKDKAVGMMTLISLAIGVAYFYSSAVVFGLKGEIFFWELATLIDIMLLGHWVEMKSVMGASKALEKLSALIPDNAHLLKGKDIVEIKTSELEDGDVILIKPGEKIPTDGLVINGQSFVNESMLTGESKPVLKAKGDKVIGGAVNEDGSLQVEVKGVGSSSYLNKVINLVKQAQASKSKTQALADKAAFWLTIGAILIGVVTFISWIMAGKDLAFAIERTATVLVIACPHALGLAVPLVVAISTTLSARNGLLIRNRTAFENARKISTIIFDKTGTLTEGTFGVENIFVFKNDYDKDKLLSYFAGLEKNSEHPIAKAILKEAKNKNISIPEVGQFRAIKGKGVEGIINGKKIAIASPGYVKELGLNIPENVEDAGKTTIFLVVENQLVGAASLTDAIRKESYDAVKIIKKAGIKTWMLTGDNENSAKAVSETLGLDGYFAGVLPDQKQEKIKELQNKGEFVAMVGDGINDAPALAQADVGIAIGSGTDVAAETADIILVNSNPKDISSLILFGKATYKKMVQNLIWATGYNIFAIPLAAGVLAGYGILLSPAVGAALMSLSTVVVAVNANLLKIKK
ncbi:MAG: copper-translocating P-type ATPase [Patescibacteria group bacterium]